MMTAFFVAGTEFRKRYWLRRKLKELTWKLRMFAKVLGEYLVPSFEKVTEAIKEFTKALGKGDKNGRRNQAATIRDRQATTED